MWSTISSMTRSPPGQTLRLTQYRVTQAEIKVEFNNSYRRQSLHFTLTAPDRCTLGLDGDDRNLREMLVRSGIEQR